MIYGWLADLVLLLHAGFLLFVTLGGLLTFRWPRVAWVHVPLALWGALVELAGLICPLTPLENAFRRLAGRPRYAGGFIEHYVTAVMYPAGLTRGIQVFLGVSLLAGNVLIYTWLALARRSDGAGSRRRRPPP